MVTKLSKTYQSISPIADLILQGKILCVDPSTGSKSSQPGFAWFENGKLMESGELFVDHTGTRNARLYEIARTIREDFPQPDILVVEYIPPVRYGKGGMNNISLMALQKSIGAIMGAREIKYMLEIPAVTWKNYTQADYYKTDFKDAESLGFCALAIARQVLSDNQLKLEKLDKSSSKKKGK